MSEINAITVRPVTRTRLNDLRSFANANGKFGYCSCMKWRMTSSEFKGSSREERAQRLDRLVAKGAPVGLLAYLEDQPVGWAALAPRGDFEGLRRARTLPEVDDSTWVALCFYVVAGYRGRGIQHALLESAVSEARKRGGTELVGYPVPSNSRLYRYMGSTEVFIESGFEDITPASAKRTVMRRNL